MYMFLLSYFVFRSKKKFLFKIRKRIDFYLMMFYGMYINEV